MVATMKRLMTFTIVFMSILVAMSTGLQVITAFVQKANAIYENCNSTGIINYNSTTCVNLNQNYKRVTLAYLLEGNTNLKSNHNDTAIARNMNIHPYNNIPFLLPFP